MRVSRAQQTMTFSGESERRLLFLSDSNNNKSKKNKRTCSFLCPGLGFINSLRDISIIFLIFDLEPDSLISFLFFS